MSRCAVETKLGIEQSLELDAFIADPAQWPKAIFAGWKLPPGPLPGNFRAWGSVKVAMEWCESRGYTFSRKVIERHVVEHVPILPFSTDDFATRGAETPGKPSPQLPTNVISYMQVYQRGLSIGYKAIEQLEKRIDALVAEGKPVSMDLLLRLADLGTKLATSQASIVARGAAMNNDRDDEIEGFRSGSAPLPSQRFGSSRIRVIEGQARPIIDEGPADRRAYNERARQEGSPTLPAP